jgi:hypothetical protein
MATLSYVLLGVVLAHKLTKEQASDFQVLYDRAVERCDASSRLRSWQSRRRKDARCSRVVTQADPTGLHYRSHEVCHCNPHINTWLLEKDTTNPFSAQGPKL